MENIGDDVRRRRWKFIGPIKRKEYENDCRTAMTSALKGCWRRGRPRTTWRRIAGKERERAEWRSWSEVSTASADRADWRQSVEALKVLCESCALANSEYVCSLVHATMDL